MPVPEDAKEFTSDYSEFEGRGQWEFQWTSKKGNVSATLDAESKDIISYYAWGEDYEGQSTLVPKISKAQAIALLRIFLKRQPPASMAAWNWQTSSEGRYFIPITGIITFTLSGS